MSEVIFRVEITCEKDCKIIQELLISLGYQWHYGGKVIYSIDEGYSLISVWDDGELTFSDARRDVITFEEFLDKIESDEI